jgi:hypothetical protein
LGTDRGRSGGAPSWESVWHPDRGWAPRRWLEGVEHADRQAQLVDALARLALDLASPIREKLQASGLLLVAMTAANLRMLDRSLLRRRKAGHDTMGADRQTGAGTSIGAVRAGPRRSDLPRLAAPITGTRRRGHVKDAR